MEIVVSQAWRLKNQVIYLDFGGLEAEKPGNLFGFQDLYIEIVVSEAWRLKKQVNYRDSRIYA